MTNELNIHFKPRLKYEGLRKYDDTMPSRAYEMLSSGLSKNASAGKLGITKKTWYEWMKIYPEFEEAVEQGFMVGQAAWEELAQTPEHPQYCAKTYAFNMANIYRVVPSSVASNIIIPAEGGVDKALEIMRELSDSGAI